MARNLRRHGAEWVVVHDLPIGGECTKSRPRRERARRRVHDEHEDLSSKAWVGGNTFLCNGHRESYVHAARHGARRIARLPGVLVHGVIVVVLADDVTVKAQPDGVTAMEGL